MIDIEIQDLGPLHLVGLSQTTQLAAAETPSLWRSFGPRIQEVSARADSYRYSLRQYPEDLTEAGMTPETEYTEWAAVALSNADDTLPEGLELLRLPGGTYAHFTYRGLPENFGRALQYLMQVWMPTSGYYIDNARPHFERMGADYRPDDPEASEEVFVPVLPLTDANGFAAPSLS